MGRLLAIVGGGVWLLAIVLIAFALNLSDRPRRVPPLTSGPTLLKELNDARASHVKEGEEWAVTKVTSAHHVLVVNVEAEDVGEAQAIAAQIVNPVRNRGFDEILVYVWTARKDSTFADRRVQWTPKGGYSILVIAN